MLGEASQRLEKRAELGEGLEKVRQQSSVVRTGPHIAQDESLGETHNSPQGYTFAIFKP